MNLQSLFVKTILIVFTLFTLSCTNTKSNSGTSLPDRDPKLAKKLVTEESALLLDVRTPEEFQEGHVDGAINIPISELKSQISIVSEKTNNNLSHPIVVYCRSGARASTAKNILLDLGYKKVTNLGGFTDWIK